MEEPAAFITILLVGVNILFSYYGFKDPRILDRYRFEIGAIRGGDSQRLFSSGFLHVHIHHLFLNMICLVSFGQSVELNFGYGVLLLVYFASLLGGNLLSLLIHRNHLDYSAVGASGAVSGLVFAAVFLVPGTGIGFIFIPIYIPAWAFAIAYTLVSIWGVKEQWGNIGHAAHLGGAITGMLAAAIIAPDKIGQNLWLFLLLLGLFAAFLLWFWRNPLMLPSSSGSTVEYLKETLNNRSESNQQELLKKDMDALLAKISEQGLESLSRKERTRLDKISKELRKDD